jgi:hypothetical protein
MSEKLKSNKLVKILARLVLLVVGIWTFLVLLLLVLGPAWHFFHGDYIHYAGWRLPVPKGFHVTTRQAGPTMWRTTLGIPFWNAPYGHISVYHLPGEQDFEFTRDFQHAADALSEDAHLSGYEFWSDRDISVGNTTARCIEFRHSHERSRFLVRCFVENKPIVLFYEGDGRYLADFYSVLEGMSR